MKIDQGLGFENGLISMKNFTKRKRPKEPETKTNVLFFHIFWLEELRNGQIEIQIMISYPPTEFHAEE